MKQFLKENFGLKCVGSVETPFGCYYKYYTDNQNRWWHETGNGGDDLILTPATDEAVVIECVKEYIDMIEGEIVFNASHSVRPVEKRCNGRIVEVMPQEWIATPWGCYYWIYCDATAVRWYVDEGRLPDEVLLLDAVYIKDAIKEAFEYVDYLFDINESEGE